MATKQQSFVGSVVKSRFGEVAVLDSKIGRKYIEYHWTPVNRAGTGGGWLKVLIGRDPFMHYPFVRKATPAELEKGREERGEFLEKKSARVEASRSKLVEAKIEAGDIVRVAYSNATRKEIVLDVNWTTGKVAIVRQDVLSANLASKRRMLPVAICTKVVSGGGSFNPFNAIYEKNGIYVPEFYKQGNVVAARRPRRRSIFG
jgi:hypothetical protein